MSNGNVNANAVVFTPTDTPRQTRFQSLNTTDEREIILAIEIANNSSHTSTFVNGDTTSHSFERWLPSMCPGGCVHREGRFYVNINKKENKVEYLCMAKECNRAYDVKLEDLYT